MFVINNVAVRNVISHVSEGVAAPFGIFPFNEFFIGILFYYILVIII